ARKLIPRFIRPMKVVEGDGTSNTTLDLPEEMCKRCIHLKFHIRLLCQYEENNSVLFPKWNTQVFYDVGLSPINGPGTESSSSLNGIWAIPHESQAPITKSLRPLTGTSSSKGCQTYASCPEGQSMCMGTPKAATNGRT
ncbi:hypothetical protein V8E55_007191, partial [Tylopilus felleus]